MILLSPETYGEVPCALACLVLGLPVEGGCAATMRTAPFVGERCGKTVRYVDGDGRRVCGVHGEGTSVRAVFLAPPAGGWRR